MGWSLRRGHRVERTNQQARDHSALPLKKERHPRQFALGGKVGG